MSKTNVPRYLSNANGRTKRVNLPVLEMLIERSEQFSYPRKHLFRFSKSGFTKGYAEKAKELGNVSLVTYEEIDAER